MTKHDDNKHRQRYRLTPATALLNVESSLPYQVSLLIQQRRGRELKILLDAALACG